MTPPSLLLSLSETLKYLTSQENQCCKGVYAQFLCPAPSDAIVKDYEQKWNMKQLLISELGAL
jgi:hypothetical protein